MKKSNFKFTLFALYTISFFTFPYVLGQTHAQEKMYISSGIMTSKFWNGAGGTACCNCGIRHSGTLPEDFPYAKVRAVSFYLTDSRSNSYYTSIKRGPTPLTFILHGRKAMAVSRKLPYPVDYPVRHAWVITFNFNPPVDVVPGRTRWQLLDGDNNKYSAVLMHLSDADPVGLPGMLDQNGCQYTEHKQVWYSAKFDLVGRMSRSRPGSRNQDVIYIAHDKKSEKYNSFAGGTACCNCAVEHYGNLPDDFPVSAVNSVTFYLSNSRSNSYYTSVQKGPTALRMILGNSQSMATTVEIPPGSILPLKVPWVVVFPFNPPALAGPGMQWKLLDGDNNIYSAVWLKNSDLGRTGLPGTSRIYGSGCQYARVEKGRYSVKFDIVYKRPY